MELLTDTERGCTTAILLARGFTPKLIAELVDAGLATARPEHESDRKADGEEEDD